MSTRDDQKKRIKLSDHDNNCAVTVKSNMKNDKFMSLGQKRDIEEEQQQLHNFQLKTEDLSTDIVNKNNSVEEDYLRSVNCKLMTISEWGKACSIPHDDQHLLPIIDLREEYEFKKQRLKTAVGLTMVNLPFQTLLDGERSSELPPRNIDFLVLFELNNKKGFTLKDVCAFFFANKSKVTGQSRVPWKLREIILMR